MKKFYKHSFLSFFLFLGFFEVKTAMAQTEDVERDSTSVSHPDKVVINNIFIVGNEERILFLGK